MSNNRIALHLSLIALLMAVAGDALFHNADIIGVNLTIWMITFLCSGIWLVKKQTALKTEEPKSDDNRYRSIVFAGFTLLFSCIYCLRSSAMLHIFDFWAIMTGLMLTLISINNVQVAHIGSFLLTKSFIKSAFYCGFGGFRIFSMLDINSTNMPVLPILGRALRGILLAAIPVSLFGALLINADAVYSHYIARLFQWNIEDIVMQLFNIIIVSWILLGVYWFAWSHRIDPQLENTSRIRLAWTDIAIILGLIDLLFLTFVFVQVRYLFGGAASVKAVIGMTYSQYARQGFFELVWVAAIVTPLLLLLHWLRDTDKRTSTIYNVLSSIQIVLVFVIIASAVVRMLAYTNQYGLTELRFYPLVFMIWLSIVLILFGLTVLRNHRQYFTIGALIIAFIVGAVVHMINPAHLIARYNVDRALHGKSFDACYATDLGGDAVPVLASALSSLPKKEQGIIAYKLDHTYNKPARDWRQWNYDEANAYAIAERNRASLKALSSGTQKDPCIQEDVD